MVYKTCGDSLQPHPAPWLNCVNRISDIYFLLNHKAHGCYLIEIGKLQIIKSFWQPGHFQMVKFMHPMEFEPRLSLISWDEFFLRANTTPTGGQSGFDQNRAFVGVGWTFNKNFRAEGGYLNQYLQGYNYNATAVMHHLVMASLFVNF